MKSVLLEIHDKIKDVIDVNGNLYVFNPLAEAFHRPVQYIKRENES